MKQRILVDSAWDGSPELLSSYINQILLSLHLGYILSAGSKGSYSVTIVYSIDIKWSFFTTLKVLIMKSLIELEMLLGSDMKQGFIQHAHVQSWTYGWFSSPARGCQSPGNLFSHNHAKREMSTFTLWNSVPSH